ncbi:MAG: FAD-binding protein [Clostridia bacterium]|nr:FAD-binding protein [Clostridia bacterium]
MKIVVCLRQGLDGEINPFDACAYEAALRLDPTDITLVSMGPVTAKDLLLKLTRLGAKKAILLSDKAFAGADTLATAYTLSLLIKKLSPDLVFCGRQTLVGDTGQVGPMLAELAGFELITNVMSIDSADTEITCTTREEGTVTRSLPALLTVERINTLRLPGLRSKLGEVEILTALDIGADITRCGLSGSPTRVLRSTENKSGKRKCRFIALSELQNAIDIGLSKTKVALSSPTVSHSNKLKNVFIVGESPRAFAESISDNITVLELVDDADKLSAQIESGDPDAVLWGSDSLSKRLSAQVAAKLSLGLCADCTALEVEGDELVMIRPALSGSVIAAIKSRTRPAMATVRTLQSGLKDIVVAAGFGVRSDLDKVSEFADRLGAELVGTRKLVDNGYMPYSSQVGLTGRTVAPPVYIAIGISGAVHHIVGMERSGTVIAINSDPDAPIFEYSDFGIII